MAVIDFERECESIRTHPHLTTWQSATPAADLNHYMYGPMASFVTDCLEMHEANPFDALIGEDVSGRTPTLIAHKVLQMAASSRKIDSAPGTYFLASGLNRSNDERIENIWRSNINQQVEKMTARRNMKKVLVITDTIASGRSLERIQSALSSQGVASDSVSLGAANLYLCDRNKRLAVGVEKYPPEAVSRRHPAFDAPRVKEFRLFLNDYSRAMYAMIFNEPAPVLPTQPGYKKPGEE